MTKNYVLKLTDENYQTGQDYNLFTWPTEPGSVVTCADYKPTSECGNGFHGYLNGEGSISSNHDQKALILEVEDFIDLGGKIKFEKATVLHTGEIYEITSKLRELVGNKAIHYSNVVTTLAGQMIAGGYCSTLTGGHSSTLTGGNSSTLKGGNSSTLKGDNSSTLKGGHSSTLTGGHSSTLTGGDYSTLTGGHSSTLTGDYCSTLTSGDNSSMTIYGDTAYIIKNGTNCTLMQIYDGKTKILSLDKALKKFVLGDKVKIVEGKVVGKVD